MTDPDKSLLDRLRALKPTTSLTPPQPHPETNSSSVDPTVRKDLLADRLRSLRDQAGSAARSPPPSPPKPAVSLPQPPADTPPAQPRQGDTSGATPPFTSPPRNADGPVTDYYDDLLETDDGILEDLLGGPELDPARNLSLDARADLDTLRDLARQFSELARVQDTPGDRDSDDSAGEDMRRDVEDILAQTAAAAKVDEAEAGRPLGDLDGEKPEARSRDNDDGGRDPALLLPSVPTDLLSPTSPPENVTTTGDFDDDMARRMAALKTFKPSAQAEDDDPDALQLPSVPTFHPSDRASARSRKSGGGLAGRMGFTDDDMGTWCIVCLEDATLVCPGCDDDVYCSRCWFEMHEGQAAGFDERGHKAVRFNKDQKKKKVAVGA